MIVVGVHTCLGTVVDGHQDVSRLYIACIFADGVAVFWLLMGFFLFNNKRYDKLLLKTVRSIIVPMFIFSVFLFWTGEWLIEGIPFWDGMTHASTQIIPALKTLLTWRNPVKNAGHLWYLYIYVLIILIFPVLKSFVDYLDQEPKRQKYFMMISAGFLLLNDITDNKLAGFSHYSINGVIPAALEVIWGHILYENIAYIKRKFVTIISVITFFGMNFIREIIQYQRYLTNQGNSILYWYSLIGLICALSICIFVFSISSTIKSQKMKLRIINMASYTFLIYLVHTTVNKIMGRLGVQSAFLKTIQDIMGNGWKFEIVYTITILFAVFSISLLVAFVLKRICKIINNR